MTEDWPDPPAREDRYWDAVVRGEHPDVAIDPTLAETIARAHGLDETPAPDPAFVARLERRLVQSAAVPNRSNALVSVGLSTAPNGVAPDPPGPPVARDRIPRLWIVAQLATAALLILTLAASFAAFRLRPDQPAERAVIPAPADWSSTLLLRANVDALPAGTLDVRIDRWTFPASSGEWRAVAPSLPQFLFVEEGLITATVDARATLSRASAFKRLAAAVPQGSPISLRAGDLLVVPAAARFGLTPAGEGTGPPRLLAIYLSPPGGTVPATSIPVGIGAETLGTGTFADLPGGPGVVSLHDLFVAPWVALPAAATTGQELLVVEAGTLGLRQGPDVPELIRIAGGDRSTVVRAGTVLALRNPGEVPLRVLRLSITPTAAGDASPVSKRPARDGGGTVGGDGPERPEEV